jgi:hypothetical protein
MQASIENTNGTASPAAAAEMAESPDFNLISFHNRHATCGN